MLFNLLEKTKAQLNQLDPLKAAPQMLQQISLARPDFIQSLRQRAADDAAANRLGLVLACALAMGVKKMPTTIDALAARVQSPQTPAPQRCCITGLLVYLVQPRDLIPDDTPGGYGFVDDYAMLRAGVLQLNLAADCGEKTADLQNSLNLVAQVVPMPVVQALQQSINGMSQGLQLLGLMPQVYLDLTMQQMIQNPLQLPAMNQPANFAPAPGPSLAGGHWSGGAYFEGNNVVVPGGPSLINGQLCIPS